MTQGRGRFHGLFDFSKDEGSWEVSEFVATRSGFFILDVQTSMLFQAKESAEVRCRRSNKQFHLDIASKAFSDLTPGAHPDFAAWRFLDGEAAGEVRQGDVLRLGKQRMRVHSLVAPTSRPRSTPKSASRQMAVCFSNRARMTGLNGATQAVEHRGKLPAFKPPQSLRANASIKGLERCRICLEPESDGQLFADICQCSGQMPVHFGCAQKWILRRHERVAAGVTVLNNCAGDFRCEICKQCYPFSVEVGGTRAELFVPSELPGSAHVALTLLKKGGAESCGYVVIPLSEKPAVFSVGRSPESALHLPDLSVSNLHAEFSWARGVLRLRDLNSKYGTFRMVDRFSLDGRHHSSRIQVHKYLFEFHLFGGQQCFCAGQAKGRGSLDLWRSIPIIFRTEVTPMDPRQHGSLNLGENTHNDSKQEHAHPLPTIREKRLSTTLGPPEPKSDAKFLNSVVRKSVQRLGQPPPLPRSIPHRPNPAPNLSELLSEPSKPILPAPSAPRPRGERENVNPNIAQLIQRVKLRCEQRPFFKGRRA